MECIRRRRFFMLPSKNGFEWATTASDISGSLSILVYEDHNPKQTLERVTLKYCVSLHASYVTKI